MARPVVGIYTTAAPASWGPWRDRPSLVAPAALGVAVRQAGAIVVLLAPGPEHADGELLRKLDALIVFDDAEHLAALCDGAREAGLAMLVLDTTRITPGAPVGDYASEIRGLFATT